MPPIPAPAVLLLVAPASPPQLPSVPLPPELDRVLRDYERAWRTRDAEALAALFAEDGFVLAEGQQPVRGRRAIREAYAQSGGPLVLRALYHATSGDLGCIIGAFAQKAGDPDLGKFTLTLRRDSRGRWLILSDMDNPNQPRPAAPPAP